ncbi:CHAP domain-containing protein [Elioraea sp.]|jgi:surface antigen|uniref:CHAP domain-containing protein n=1 Tax=Elioraea sp. TaxID=2185103 RepID=UPI0021DD8880|nr:CHAP domain-containing protein [Elioraea sp.]GIX10168.1 MAG: CHAP domain-containing protein [Elioraea sp.]
MRVDRCGFRGVVALASLLAVAMPTAPAEAQANRQAVSRTAPVIGLQCVPFARHLSGIDIVGNARTWWHQAEGRYERGSRPEVGSVLTFKPTGAMRLGHVSVVSQIVSAREILVDHANWPGPGVPKGRVARSVSVIDVSDANDWTAVRVEIHGRGSGYGRIYPTWGFIYPRIVANVAVAADGAVSPAVARLNARAAAAASRPPAYVGQAGAGLDASDLIELADASDAPVRGSRPLRSPPAEPHQVVARDFGDDSLVWGAPHRSLR